MRRSTDRILTTHVGALPAPLDVWAHPEVADERLRESVAEVVDQQRRAGIDFINEGEHTKGGHWVEYLPTRLGGYEPAEGGAYVELLMSSKDWIDHQDFYLAVLGNGTLFEQSGVTQHVPEGAEATAPNDDWVATSPIHITDDGTALLDREIAIFGEALGDTPPADAFLTTTAPLSVEPGRQKGIYATDEEHVEAIAEAMRVEYEAIAAAGFQVQVDDAWLGALWDRIGIPMGMDGYRRFCEVRIEALNHALRNIPEEQVRYHLCWGSWHGPHSADLELRDVVDLILKIKAQMYLVEAANVRHEHEIGVWADVRLPDGKMLAPGVVTHSTPLIEHPELVRDRIVRWANTIGKENVIASTDCGLGLRLHPSLAWAKVDSLVTGAEMASAQLW